MAVSKEDREAYEEGRKESFWDFGPTLLHMVTDSESEAAAREKGRSGEQLDADKDPDDKSGSGCFLTTACVETLGFPDNCDELTTLRQFRDSFMLSFDEGKAEVKEYYERAPKIVKAISARPDAPMIYRRIFEEIILPCVKFIKQGHLEPARATYKKALLQFVV
jgi:hypothetical protein